MVGNPDSEIWDPDQVAISNLHRQILFRADQVDMPKVSALIDSTAALEPTWRGRLMGSVRAFCDQDVEAAFEDFDLIIEGSDSPELKVLINDAAQTRRKPTLIGGLERWSGALFLVGTGQGGCFRCLFEDAPQSGFLSCDQSGILGPLAGVVGGLLGAQAVAVLSARAPHENHWLRVTPREGPTRGRALPIRRGCPAH